MRNLSEEAKSELRDACREVASNQLSHGRLVDVGAVEQLTDAHLKSALRLATGPTDIDDHRVVLRAIRYLALRAIPPMRTDTRWFDEQLECLLVLACPFEVFSSSMDLFFQDIERGIAKSRASYSDDE